MLETLNMQGRVRLLGEARDGRIVLDRSHANRIVANGRLLVAQRFAGVPGTPPAAVSHMAVGTGATTAADEQAALVSERARNPMSAPVYTAFIEGGLIMPPEKLDGPLDPRMRVAIGDVVAGPSIPMDASGVKRVKLSLQTVFDFGEANGSVPLREAGIFTASAGGTMYNRVVFDAVTKVNTFKLTLIWDIVF